MEKKVKNIFIAVFAFMFLFVLALNSITVISAGHTGVILTMGKVEEDVMPEGVHFKIPFAQRVIEIDNRIVKMEVDTEAFSKDLQTVETTLAINYRVDPSMSYSIYKNVGSAYEDILITPAVNEVLKAITSKYTAEQSVTNRSLISDGLVQELNAKLNPMGLYVTDVNIMNFDFSEAFINAIEEKQVAQQQLLKAETEKQTAITNAEAQAETIRIKAQAEADANKLLSESISKDVIDYYVVEKWNGELSKVSGAGGIMISLDE